MVRTDIDEMRPQIESWLKDDNMPRYEICRRLRCKYHTLLLRIEKWGLTEYKNQGAKGWKADKKRLSALDYLQKGIDGRNIVSHKLKVKFIEDGIKEHRCEICKEDKWLGEKIPIELDHIDGNRYNWSFDNLRIICPNCHAQQDTSSGKNYGKYRVGDTELINSNHTRDMIVTNT